MRCTDDSQRARHYGIVHRQIVEGVSKQPDASIAGVAHAERRSERHLPFNRQIPLLRVRHFQTRIDQRQGMTLAVCGPGVKTKPLVGSVRLTGLKVAVVMPTGCRRTRLVD